MNQLFLIVVLFSLIEATAFADSFYLDKGGVRYFCDAINDNPGGGLDCVEQAYAGPFSRDEATRLCAGASDIYPASCGIAAYKGPFSKDEAIQLCSRAHSMGPSDCAVKAYAGPFSKSESIDLCRDNGNLNNADCAIKAYAGPYSKEEAIRLCKHNPDLLIKTLDIMLRNDVQMRKRFEVLSVQKINVLGNFEKN